MSKCRLSIPRCFWPLSGREKNRTTLYTRQIVFSQGDPADAVFFIEEGKIELKVVSPQGKEAVLAILGVGEFVGEGALAGQPLRMATAVAATDCSVMRIEKSAMIEVLTHSDRGNGPRILSREGDVSGPVRRSLRRGRHRRGGV
jgi:CRP-like cAMP-binding protein